MASTQSGICPSETNKQLAQRGDLVELAGDNAVQRVGQHRGQISDQRAGRVPDHEPPDDDGQKQNPHHRQGVRNIDDLILFNMLHGMSPLPAVSVYHKNGAVCR